MAGSTSAVLAPASSTRSFNGCGDTLGLVPFWAKDIKVGFANINAKAKGLQTRPAFREAFQRRRCLVLVDSIYEVKTTAAGKQPYAIGLADLKLVASVF
jgi:putative SOS response-associated peptidase YedK